MLLWWRMVVFTVGFIQVLLLTVWLSVRFQFLYHRHTWHEVYYSGEVVR